jgi:hypothetical protein
LNDIQIKKLFQKTTAIGKISSAHDAPKSQAHAIEHKEVHIISGKHKTAVRMRPVFSFRVYQHASPSSHFQGVPLHE